MKTKELIESEQSSTEVTKSLTENSLTHLSFDEIPGDLQRFLKKLVYAGDVSRIIELDTLYKVSIESSIIDRKQLKLISGHHFVMSITPSHLGYTLNIEK